MSKLCHMFMIFFILLAGCQQNEDVQTDSQEENEVVREENNQDSTEGQSESESVKEEEAEPQKNEKDIVLEKADKVLLLLKDKHAEELSKYVHPDKGVLFSPYAHIEKDAVTFKQEDMPHYFHIEEEYTWGIKDGSGEPITLTPSRYYEEFIYNASYDKADEVALNPEQSRGNMIKNITDVFPNSHVVEYYVKGTEENGHMDWKALNLVFEKDSSGEWMLVAIVQDQWTI